MEDLRQIRNISIIAHIDAGKTSTTERMLYYSGKTHRLGDIDDGTTVMDYLEEERRRGITIVSAAASFPWRDCLIHLIDTPGHIDFTVEVERSLRVIDAAVVIFSGVEGVEAQSEKVWRQADRYRLPRLAFVNKLDRIGADYARVCQEIGDKFGGRAVPIQFPIGQESEFRGMVDLLTSEYLTFTGEGGAEVVRQPVPAEESAAVEAARIRLVERLADLTDAIAEPYLEGTPIGAELLAQELRRLTLAGQVVPVLCGSAKRNLGVQPLLDAVLAYLPSPADVPAIPAMAAKTLEPVTLEPDPAAPFAGFIFKVVASTTADLYYLRTYAGTLKTGDSLFLPRTNEMIRAKRLLRLYAKQTEPIEQAGPGDIVGLTGPKDLLTGDTLCLRHKAVVFEKPQFPEPVLSMAVEPRSGKDKDRLDEALQLLLREDPTLALKRDENTGQRILAGMGELHLEINTKRIDSDFHVPIRCGEPRVAYRETVNREVATTATFSKVLGETPLYAKVSLTLRPKEAGDPPFVTTSTIRDPAIPKQLIKVALEALSDGIKTGGQSGYPLIYVAAELNELGIQADQTTDGAILGAVLMALNQAINEAGTQILEPIMRLEVTTPEANLGDVTGEINKRHGLIHQVEDLLDMKRVHCEVPLAAMFGFSKSLPKLTGGRGSCSMEPCGYRPQAAPPA